MEVVNGVGVFEEDQGTQKYSESSSEVRIFRKFENIQKKKKIEKKKYKIFRKFNIQKGRARLSKEIRYCVHNWFEVLD